MNTPQIWNIQDVDGDIVSVDGIKVGWVNESVVWNDPKQFFHEADGIEQETGGDDE